MVWKSFPFFDVFGACEDKKVTFFRTLHCTSDTEYREIYKNCRVNKKLRRHYSGKIKDRVLENHVAQRWRMNFSDVFRNLIIFLNYAWRA